MSAGRIDRARLPQSEPAPVRITPHANGCLTLELRRPKALNSLSTPMVRLLTRGLRDEAARAGKTKCVLVYGEGEKAFCAGGDIRALAFPSEPFEPSKFFREEYTLNHLVATFPAPYVAIMRGITMGGGVGISVHGHVRIVTDNTMFAMPETGIGLYPDVGGSYFMPRLPGAIGMYLALTGQSIGAVRRGEAQNKQAYEINEMMNLTVLFLSGVRLGRLYVRRCGHALRAARLHHRSDP